MNILVTGGAGYIGSHTCKALSQSGYTPVTFDSLIMGHREAVRWGPFVQGELHNTELLVDTLKTHVIGAVLHFAAFAFVGESVRRPDMYYQNNVGGSLALLTAMQQAGVKKIVFSSTAATYGTPQYSPITETHPQNPINPYGASKAMVERILGDYAVAYNVASVSLRYFNAAGADPDGELREAHNPETHLIPLALAAILNPSKPLTVYGSDYATPDGTCVRDYIHVSDLADAHVLALKTLLTQSTATAAAYNLGNGQGFSVREVLNAVAQVTGQAVPHTLGARRSGDPDVLVADSKSAKHALNWQPRYPAITDIVKSAWNVTADKTAPP